MNKKTIEYLVYAKDDLSFFVNPERVFTDFPSQGHRAEKIVREGTKVVSRELVVFDKNLGWMKA